MAPQYVPGGELFHYLTKAERFPESTCRFYGAQVRIAVRGTTACNHIHSLSPLPFPLPQQQLTMTLDYLHGRGLIHR